jgi:hypothetical protein
MAQRQIDDWTTLTGASVEIRRGGLVVCGGNVDSVTSDGSVLWVTPMAATRRLYEKSESYVAWISDESLQRLDG